MKKLVLVGLIAAVGTSFAEPMPTQSQPPMPTQPQPDIQPSPMPQPTPPPQLNPMPPIEIKPEDKAIIDLKKKLTMKKTYNDYQKIDKATSIDRINLERSLREAKYSLKTQIYKDKQLDAQLLHPYYYNIPIVGVVGNVALTYQTPLKDGTVLKDKDRISIKDGVVYVGDYLISYPVMNSIVQPDVSLVSSPSTPQLLTGLPTTDNSPSGSPPIPLPPPR